jgi:nickel-dependent lactate racemase
MRSIEIPWGAWYGDVSKQVTFPDRAEIKVVNIPSRSTLAAQFIDRKLKDLAELLGKKKPRNVIIVVDDLTRPVKLENLINPLLHLLKSFDIQQKNTKILIGLGGHRPLEKDDLRKKLGPDCVESYKIFNHSPFENLVRLPVEWKGTPIEMNRHFVESDFRIVISGLVPHSFAGFSGGAKMLIPGISNLEVVKRTHKSVLMGFMGKLGDTDNNRFRREIEAIVQEIGVDYFLGVLINPNREIAAIHGGDIINAYHDAVRDARDYYTMKVPDGPFDMILMNAYPKDTELLQCENAFFPLQSASKPLVRENGLVVVVDACSERIGHHELFGPNKALYRAPMPKRFLNPYEVIFFSENLVEKEFREIFWSGYRFHDRWERVYDFIEKKFERDFRVIVFPFASMQLVS